LFWFLLPPTAKTPAQIFTISASNDVVSRKDVPFGGPENKILHIENAQNIPMSTLGDVRHLEFDRK